MEKKRAHFTFLLVFLVLASSFILATSSSTITGFIPFPFSAARDDATKGVEKIDVSGLTPCITDQECSGGICNYVTRTPPPDSQKYCLSTTLADKDPCSWDNQCKSEYCGFDQADLTKTVCLPSKDATGTPISRTLNDECSLTFPCEESLVCSSTKVTSSLIYNSCIKKSEEIITPPTFCTTDAQCTQTNGATFFCSKPTGATATTPGTCLSTSANSALTLKQNQPRCVELKATDFPGITTDGEFGNLWICRVLPQKLIKAPTKKVVPSYEEGVTKNVLVS